MTEESRPAELFQLDRSTCLALLSTQRVGRLLVDDTDSPVVIVNYTLRDGLILFRSDPGRRVAAIVNTKVVFEVDMFDERTKSGWSVVARGTAHDLTSSEPADELVEVDTWAPGPKSCRIGITVDHVTGRLLRGEVPASWVHPHGYL